MLDLKSEDNIRFMPLISGYILSLLCTIGAYLLVFTRIAEGRLLFELVTALGLLQMAVQVTFFFRFGKENRPRWNMIMFILLVIVMLFIIAGSIWIMNNLNYYNMSHVRES